MNSPEYPAAGAPPPKKENQLQGPRPQPLTVRKDSHKIKKSPPPPPPHQQREPIVIYSLPQRVIHVTKENFKDLVQRLTGLPPGADVSPAARLASIEKTSPTKRETERVSHNANDNNVTWMSEKGVEVGQFPGILPPLPATFPPLPANLPPPLPATLPPPLPATFPPLPPLPATLPATFPPLPPLPATFPPLPPLPATLPATFPPLPPLPATLPPPLPPLSPARETQTLPYWNEFWSCSPTQTAPSSAFVSVPEASPQPSPNLFSLFDYK